MQARPVPLPQNRAVAQRSVDCLRIIGLNLDISILITRRETSRARAVDTRVFRVRPLAHQHVVALGKQSHQLISQLPSTPALPAANTYRTRDLELRPDETFWPPLYTTKRRLPGPY
jgi:hypothetical protein